MEQPGKWLMFLGAAIVALGFLLHFAPWLLNWFGKLPGDIHIETERSKVFIPITSMIVVSIVLSVIINLFRK